MLSWGIRMAIAAMIPLIWGIVTNHINEATWITLTAECICWIELKGGYAWRIRILLIGSLLAVIFATLGTLTAENLWLSVLCMLGVGFISGLFKNLGDRGSGLSICVYLLFIICNAYPENSFFKVKERSLYVAIGAVWTVAVSLAITLLTPTGQPYRRQIALIWRAISGLLTEISTGWETNKRSNIRDIYLKEKEVRTALDSSFQFFEAMAHQVSEKQKDEYQLAQLRKVTALVSVNIIAISEETELLQIKDTDSSLKLRLSSLFRTLQQAVEHMAVYVVTLRPEERLLVNSRLSRLKKLTTVIKESEDVKNPKQQKTIGRILQLTERNIRLIEKGMEQMGLLEKDLPAYHSFSLIKTLFVLHPKHWWQNVKILFSFNSFTTRYALRIAVAASTALFIYRWFHIDHGYWLPFSVIIVIQPYFGATFKKAVDRIIGTLLGGLAGSLFLYFHWGLHIKEVVLTISFIMMVYYLRKNYALAAFFITLNLVLLFNIEAALNLKLLETRFFSTIGGAALAVIAGFAFLPHWDKKWLPIYFAEAVQTNYRYFIASFFRQRIGFNWIRFKRSSESKNSSAFDSFNRYLQEPGNTQKATIFYELITHNIRITRDLNHTHLEGENRQPGSAVPLELQKAKLTECLLRFNKVVEILHYFDPEIKESNLAIDEKVLFEYRLNDIQMQYLERLLIELDTMYQDMTRYVDATTANSII